MHTCDNPRCVNIEHLRPGTFEKNNADRANKNRSAKIVLSRRKFCRNEAAELFRQGFNFSQIAKKLGVAYGGRFVRDVRRRVVTSD